MNICVIGTGYVGLVTGVVFSDLGNEVVCVDKNEEKIALLRAGVMPIYEPGLEEMVARNYDEGRLTFTTDLESGIRKAEVIFICVGTPPKDDGATDMSQVEGAARGIAAAMDRYKVIVNKSTVPVGTGDFVRDIIETNKRRNVDFDVVSNPEFLREGSAIQDTLHPDRIVIGAPNQIVAMKILELYAPLERPMIITDVASAEMIKYASNAFLAMKISFANSIANICEQVGADVIQVVKGMGLDSRIGSAFLNAGLGYGGSCFTGEETVFTVRCGDTRAERFDSLFAASGTPLRDKGMDVVKPHCLSVVATDLETGKPTVAPVEVLTRREFTGNLVTIRTGMGRFLRVTGDHPVILRNDEGGFDIRRAERVKVGDRILALTTLPELPAAPTQLNLIDLLAGSPLEADVHVTPTDDSFRAQFANFASHVPASILRHPNEIKRFNRMPLRLYRHLTAQGVLDVPADKLLLYTAKGAATKIRAVVPVDAAFARLCGYYLAEGCIVNDTGRAGAVRDRILFSFHEDEREYISDVRCALESLGLKWIEKNATRANTTIVSSRVFAFLLRDVLGMGVRSDDKALPPFAFSLSAELRREVVRGAFSGDGSIEPLQGGKNLAYVYATVSKRLADGMSLLLQSLGVVASLEARWMRKSTRPAYLLTVSGFSQLSSLSDAFGEMGRARIAPILAGYTRHIKQRGFEREADFAALTVRAVEREPVTMPVYSMETATGTLTVGSGLLVHNCFPKDSSSLLHTARSVGYEFPLLAATIDTNMEQPKRFIAKMEQTLGGFEGKRVAVLGLAFKANTDDMRDAKSIDIISALLDGGATVTAYDPIAMENTKRTFPNIGYAKNAWDAADKADAVVVVTEWNEFKQINLEKLRETMAGDVVFDGRNLYDPAKMKRLGFRYVCVGRPTDAATPIAKVERVTAKSK